MSSKKQQGGRSGGRRQGRRVNQNGLLDSAGKAVAVAVSAALSGVLTQSAHAKGGIKVEKVARGTAQFTTRGPNTQITVSDRAIINYRQFDVARNEGVQFVQPSPQSRVLNRINSAEPSRIDGRISANGIVYFVNPSGVMFGRDSVINVGKLYAAAANISDGDFVNGVNRFVGGLGSVINEGKIHADAVTLVGRRVINQGEILSTSAVTMVAGDDVLVGERDGNLFVKVDTVQGLAGSTGNKATAKGAAVPLGAGDMFSMAVYNEGRIKARQITAQSGVGGATIVAGKLDASSAKAGETGGTIKVLGDKVAVAGATIDASGPAGGGTVLVGGDFQGKGAVPTASRTVVTANSTIKADATGNGPGGKVVVWADGATTFAGSISARGGASGGNGGNVEVSGKQTLNFTGTVDTTAAAGATGSLLLDPDSIDIVAGAAGTGADDLSIDVGGLLNDATAAPASVISAGTLEALGLGAHVSLTATDKIMSVLPLLDLKQEGTGSVALAAGKILMHDTTISTHGAPVTLSADTALDVGGVTTNAGAATGGAVTLTLSAGGTLVSGPITTAGTAAGGKVTVNATSATDAGAVTLGAINAGTGATAGDVTIASAAGGVTLQQITGKAVDVSASGDVLGTGTITGTSVKLVSTGGSVGDLLTPAPISVDATAGVIVEAKNDVAITDPTGTMTIDHVTATTGSASISALGGDLLTSANGVVKAGVKATVTSTGKVGTDADNPLVVDAKEAALTSATDLHVKLPQLTAGATVKSATDGAAGLYTVQLTGTASEKYELTYAKANDLTLVVPGAIGNDTTTTPTPPAQVIAANVLTLDAASLGAPGSALATDAAELKAVAHAGGIAIANANALKTREVTATTGDVAIDVVKGDLTITDTISGTAVALTAGHDIVNGAVAKRITAGGVSLEAGTDSAETSAKIGTVASPILTAATTLSLKSDRGTDAVNSGVNASDIDGIELTANAGGRVNVTTVGNGDLTVNQVTGGSVLLHATAGSVLAKSSTSTLTATGTVASLVDIVASKDVGKLDDPANPTAGGLLNVDAVSGLVSLSGVSVYVNNVASGTDGNIELTAPVAPANIGLDRDGVQSYALTVTNDLTLRTKGWIRDTAAQQLSLGGTVDLRSATDGIGQSGAPVLTSAKAIRATANGSGGVFITDNGVTGVDVKDVTTQGQPIQLVSTAGSLNLQGKVDAGTAGPSDVLLKAAKDIKGAAGHHVTGDEVTMIAGTAGAGSVGASSLPADAILVDARTLTLRAAGVTPTSGSINVNANDPAGAPLSVLEATAGDGPITIKTKGDLTLTHVATSKTAATGVVTLTSVAGAIKDGGDAFADVIGNKVTLVAQTGIGAGNALETGALVIGGAGSETQTSTGGIALANDATGLIPPLPVGTSTQVWLKAGSGDVALTQTGLVALTVSRATTGDGLVSIENVGQAIKLAGDVTAGGTDKTADVKAGNEISRTGGVVEADHVSLTAGRDAATGDFGIGAAGAQVKTKTNDLTLTSANAGDIYVDNVARAGGTAVSLTALTVDTATPGNAGTGNIVVTTNGTQGLNVVNAATGQGAGLGKGRVALQASEGAITDGTGSSPSISAKELSLQATAIGADASNPLDTDVLTLAAKTTVGRIDVRNTAAGLTVGAVLGTDDVTPLIVTGMTAPGATIDLTQTHGALVVNNALDAGAAEVFVRAVETGTGTLVNNSLIKGQGVTLIADNMQLAAASQVQAGAGRLTLQTATAARPISLGTVGESAGSLNLSDVEFDTLSTSDRIEIGAASAGPVNFTAPISLSPARATTLAIVTGGSVTQDVGGFTAFEGNQLSIDAVTGVGTTRSLLLKVKELAATTDAGGVRAANDGDLRLTQVGDVDNVSSGSNATITNGDVDLTSTGTLTVDSTVAATGSVHLKADNTLATNSVIVNNTIDAGTVTGGHADANLSIEANQNVVINKHVSAKQDVSLTTASGDVAVHDRVDAQTGKVTIDARKGALSDTSGDIAANTSVSISSHTGGIDLGKSVTATQQGITLAAGDTGLGNANNDIHTGVAGTLSAGGAVTLVAQDAISTAGAITTGTAAVSGDVKMTAVAGGILVENAVTASSGGGITADAKQDVRTRKDASASIDSPLTADAGVTLTSSNGSVTTEARVQAGTTILPGGIAATATLGNVTESGGWSAKGSATADAGGDVTFASGVVAGGLIRGSAGGNVISKPAGTLDAGASVLLTATNGGVSLDASVLARGGEITATGKTGVATGPNTGSAATLDANTFVSLTSSAGGVATHANVTANGTDITATAHLDVTADGAWSAKRDIIAKADGNVTSTAKGSMLAGRHVEVTALHGVDLGAGVTSGAQPPATGTPTDGHIEVVASGGNVVTQSGAALDARSHVLLDATGDVLAHGDVSAGQRAPGAGVPATVTATAGGDVRTDGTIKARDEVTVTAGGNVDVTGATASDDKSITATATTGSVTTTGTLSAQTFINLDANQNVAVNNNAAARTQSITATAHTGDVTTTGILSAGTFINLDAQQNVAVNNNATAQTQSITATAHSLDVTTTGALSAGTFILLDANRNVGASNSATTQTNDITALAHTGDVTTTGALSAGSFVLLDAKQNVTTNNSVTARGTSITANAATGNVKTNAPLLAKSFILLDADQNVAINDTATAQTASITATATRANVTSGIAGDLLANTFVDLTAGRDVSLLGTVAATTDHVNILAGTLAPPTGSITTADAIAAGTFVHMTAPNDVTVLGSATAGTLRSSTLPGDVTINAGGNILTGVAGPLTAETFVDLEAPAGRIDLNAPVTANRQYIQGTAGGNITTASTAPLKANTSVLLLSKNASVITHGAATATTLDIRADAATDVQVDAAWSAGNDVPANAGNDVASTLAGTITAGHAIALDAGHDVALRAAATANADSITATANHDVTSFINGVMTAGTSITLDAGHDVNLAGNATARNQFIKATAGNDVTTTTGQLAGHTFVDLQAGADISLDSSAAAVVDYLKAHALGGNIATGTNAPLSAGSFVDLQALNGQIDLSAPVTANGQYVQALARGNITTAKTAPVVANTFVLLDSSARSVISHGSVTAKASDITANAAVDVIVDAPWSAGNDVLATAGHDVASTTLGTITGNRRVILLAGNDVTLDAAATANSDFLKATATSGDITTGLGGAASAGSFVDLQALNGAITLAAPVTAKGDYVQALAKRDITSAVTAPITAESHVLFDSSAGSVITHGSVTAKGSDITANAAVDVLADAAWSAGNDILATAGHDITSTPLGTMTAARHIELTASNDITLHGDTTAVAGHILGTAGHDILTSGQIQAGLDVTFDAGHGITSGTNRVTAGTDISYHAHTGDIATFTGALLTAGNDVLLAADHGRIDLRDDVTGKRDVIATAQNDITTFLGAPITATNRNVTLTSTGGSILTQDLVKAGADLLADAAGDITLTGGWQSGGNTTADAGGDISVRSTSAYGAAGLFTAGNDVAFTLTGALVKGGGPGDTKVIAGNNIGMAAGSMIDGGGAQVLGQAGHNIQLALVKTNVSGTNPDANPAAVTLVAGTKGGGTITDLHTFSAGSGAVGTAGVVANGGGLDATAPNVIDLGTQVAWVKARSQSGGDLTLNEVDALHVVEATTKNGAVTITSGDTMLVRDVVAGGADALLRAYTNDIVVEGGSHQGSVTAAGHKATLTAANSILGNTTWRNVISTDLEATAGGVITLGTDVDNVVSTSSGKTTLHDFGSVTLKSVTTSGGDVDVAADGSITANTVRAGSGGGNNVLLTAGGNIGKEGTGPNVQSNRLDAKAGGSIDLITRVATVNSLSNGDTTFVERDDLTLEHVESKAGNIDVTTAGRMDVQEVVARPSDTTITLTSGGDIAGDTGKNPNVLGDRLVTSANGTILLNTEVNTLTSDSTGDATFHEKSDVAIRTVTSGGEVTLTATNGAITDANGAGTTNVTSKNLDATAKSIDLDTKVDSLALTGLGGDVTVREADDVDVNRLDFVAGNTGALDLSVAAGGTMRMHTQFTRLKRGKTQTVQGVDTKGGDQTYTGDMVLAGTPGTFLLNGNNILLNATVTGSSAYGLEVNSAGLTTVHRDVTMGGRIAFDGKTLVEFDPALGLDDRTSTKVESAFTSTAGEAAITFANLAMVSNTVELVTHAGDVHLDGGASGKGRATIRTNSGNVVVGVQDGATQSVTGGKLSLAIDTILSDHRKGSERVVDLNQKRGDVTFLGSADLRTLGVTAGNIEVESVDARNGDVRLAPDPRITIDSVPSKSDQSAGVLTEFSASSGLITLHGNLTASGVIELGNPGVDRTKLVVKSPSLNPLLIDPQVSINVPAIATIVAYSGKLTPTTTEDQAAIKLVLTAPTVTMGKWDKLTVLGDVEIHASSGAKLSDISALGQIDVVSPSIEIIPREKGLLLTSDGVLGQKNDEGVDFYANGNITFSSKPFGVSTSGQEVQFGVGPDGLGNVNGFGFRRRRDKAGLDKFVYFEDTALAAPGKIVVLDSTADGPSSTDISVTITQALPQEAPKPTEDTNLSTANQKRLIEMGIYARNANNQEIVDRVSGRVVYLDIPPNGIVPRPSDYTVVAGKLPQVLTRALIEADDQIVVNANSPDPEKAVPGKAIQQLLADALAKFSEANGNPKRLDPVAFRTFLASSDYQAASAMLDKFKELLHRVEVMGLTEKQGAYYREQLLSRIIPRGMAVDELYEVIRAEPDRKFTYAPAAPAPGR